MVQIMYNKIHFYNAVVAFNQYLDQSNTHHGQPQKLKITHNSK